MVVVTEINVGEIDWRWTGCVFCPLLSFTLSAMNVGNSIRVMQTEWHSISALILFTFHLTNLQITNMDMCLCTVSDPPLPQEIRCSSFASCLILFLFFNFSEGVHLVFFSFLICAKFNKASVLAERYNWVFMQEGINRGLSLLSNCLLGIEKQQQAISDYWD